MYYLIYLLISLIVSVEYHSADLQWADEFTYHGAPDSSKWSYDLGNGSDGWGNQELQVYTRDPMNVFVVDGKLYIVARQESDGRWTSARMVTRHKNHFQYGRIEFRARLPQGIGTWPNVWLLGENHNEVGWPSCGSINLVGHVGKEPGHVYSALYMSHPAKDYHKELELHNLENAEKEFHVYEMNWTPNAISFSIDGELVHTYAPEVKNAYNWPFDKPFYLLLNVAMGGRKGSLGALESNGLHNGIDPKLKVAIMEVDYIRVYNN
ncbi:MAG: glycoside hydrolase family 16 protein [Saprospiraceae bacterium]|nr:glycoside hydrolase family 16 protein [Saprospiraceae bacterium]